MQENLEDLITPGADKYLIRIMQIIEDLPIYTTEHPRVERGGQSEPNHKFLERKWWDI